jgi:Uma2 family endonuclease
MSYEEFLASDYFRAEWVDGEVIEMSPASSLHQDLVDFLAALLRHYTESRGGGFVRSAPFQMKVGARGREPDVVYVAPENLERVKKNHIAGPADLAVEIVSEDSVRRDREVKLREYREAGVREFWLVDPLVREARFLALNERGEYEPLASDADGNVRSRVLEGLWLKVDWLWQQPLPPLLFVLRAWGLIS